MKKIAVTGALGAGKSTVCQLLKQSGGYTVDADAIVHHLLGNESPTAEQVIKLLGPDIITQKQIDRKKVSNIVFSNPPQLQALESILHPAVRVEINRLFETVKNNKAYRFFVAEVPLLFEAHMENDFDAVIAVIADKKIARKRAVNAREFDRRTLLQLPSAIKASQATFVIKNQGNLDTLKAQVARLIPQLI